MEGDKPRLNAIWKYNAATDRIEETGIPSKMRETFVQQLNYSCSIRATRQAKRANLGIY